MPRFVTLIFAVSTITVSEFQFQCGFDFFSTHTTVCLIYFSHDDLWETTVTLLAYMAILTTFFFFQKKFRAHRDTMMENVSNELHAFFEKNPNQEVNLRKIFQSQLFGLAMKQVSYLNATKNTIFLSMGQK